MPALTDVLAALVEAGVVGQPEPTASPQRRPTGLFGPGKGPYLRSVPLPREYLRANRGPRPGRRHDSLPQHARTAIARRMTKRAARPVTEPVLPPDAMLKGYGWITDDSENYGVGERALNYDIYEVKWRDGVVRGWEPGLRDVPRRVDPELPPWKHFTTSPYLRLVAELDEERRAAFRRTREQQREEWEVRVRQGFAAVREAQVAVRVVERVEAEDDAAEEARRLAESAAFQKLRKAGMSAEDAWERIWG